MLTQQHFISESFTESYDPSDPIEALRIYQPEFYQALCTSTVGCPHPDDAVDDGSRCCMDCGYFLGYVPIAPTEAATNLHSYAVTSAEASAIARKKKKDLLTHTFKAGTILSAGGKESETKEEIQAVKRTDARRKIVAVIPTEIQEPTSFFIVSEQVTPIPIEVPPPTKLALYRGAKETADKRLQHLSQLAQALFTPIPYLATGAFHYQNSKACPVINKLLTGGHTLEELNITILENIHPVFEKYFVHFNGAQRKRLHNTALFVVLLVSHIEIIHCSGLGNSALPEDLQGIEECLEIERIRSKLKPSAFSLKTTRRSSLLVILADLLGTTTAAATRFALEVYDLILPDELKDASLLKRTRVRGESSSVRGESVSSVASSVASPEIRVNGDLGVLAVAKKRGRPRKYMADVKASIEGLRIYSEVGGMASETSGSGEFTK